MAVFHYAVRVLARPTILALLAALSACTAPDAAAGRSALFEAPRLVAVGDPTRGPEGSDAVPRVRVAFRMPDGSLRSVDRAAIAFVPRFGDGAALVDPDRRLYEVTPDGMRRMLAADASGSLAVSDDGARLAYVIVGDVFGALRVHDGAQETTLAEGLASIGVLRFHGEHVLFVGGRPGGVAGVWIATPADGARCLTNCTLRTGMAWQDRFVPPPSEPDTFELVDDVVAWTDPSGTRRSISLGEVAR